MKILAISDTHGDSDLVKKIAEMAQKEKVDAILHAGDLTWFDEPQDGIVGPLAKNNPLLMIHGNHEPHSTIKHFENIYPLAKSIHKKSHTIKDVGFFGSGTTDWGYIEDSEEVFEELKKAHSEIKHLKKKVMITHGPPTGSAIELMGFPGSYGVRKAIQKFKPDIVICGHIHEGGGLIENIDGTKVINAAFSPTIFEI
jgi:Icc-related predicted phosphoesterase